MLVTGAVLFIVHLLARSAITAEMAPLAFLTHPLWVPINVLGAIGAALVVLGLPVMYSRLTRWGGSSSVVGVVLLSAAWLFLGLFVSVYAALVAPWLASNAPDLVKASAPPPRGVVIAFVLALLVELIGSILLGAAFIRGRLSPRWVGHALPIAAVLTIVGSLLAPTGPASNLAMNLATNSGPLLLMAVFVRLGAQES